MNTPEPSRIPRLVLAAAGALSLALYIVLAVTPNLATRPVLYLVLHGMLAALMVAAVLVARRAMLFSLRVAVVGAVLFRLVLVAAPPLLSPDLHRYLWDGQMARHGINPFARPADDPVFDRLPREHRSRVIYPELPTIYPPVAQAAFHGVAMTGASARVWKAVTALADIAVLLLLMGWPFKGRRYRVALLYGWNPLVVMETAGSGHLEPLGVLLVLLGARAIIAGLGGVSTLAWVGSALVKPVTLVAAPAFLRRAGWLRALPLAALAVAVLYWPYRRLGWAALGSLGTYLRQWSFNSPAYEACRAGLESIDLAGRLTTLVSRLREWTDYADWAQPLYDYVHPELWARLMLGAALVALILLTWRRRPPLERELLVVTAGALFLAPTIHPWYLLWVLPFAVLLESWPILLLSLLVPLAYLPAARGEAVGPLLMLAQFGPVALWAMARRLRRRRGGSIAPPVSEDSAG